MPQHAFLSEIGGGGGGAAGPPMAAYRAGHWSVPLGGGNNAAAPIPNIINLLPQYLAEATYDRLGVTVTVVGSAGATMRLGIYEADDDAMPGELVVDGGTVAATSTGLLTVTINEILPAGLYFLASAGQGSPVTDPTVGVLAGTSFNIPLVHDSPNQFAANGYYSLVAGSGAFPADFTGVAVYPNGSTTRVFARMV